jgi:hypothetical protein
MFGSNVMKGLFLLARGKASGIAEFGNTIDALYASLAPLIAFPLVLAIVLGLNGQPEAASVAFLSQLCAVLFVSVATHGFAVWARREPVWLRTATALNWSIWLLVPLLFLGGFAGALMVMAGTSKQIAVDVMFVFTAVYLLWYHWFTVRCGLQVKFLPALGIVLGTNFVIGLLSVGPDLIDQIFSKP